MLKVNLQETMESCFFILKLVHFENKAFQHIWIISKFEHEVRILLVSSNTSVLRSRLTKIFWAFYERILLVNNFACKPYISRQTSLVVFYGKVNYAHGILSL